MSLHIYKHNNFVQRLLDREIVTDAQLEKAIALRKGEMAGADLLAIFVSLGYIDLDEVCKDVAERFQLSYVQLSEMEIPAEVVSLLDGNVARFFRAIPIEDRGEEVVVAMDDPTNLSIVERISGLLGKTAMPAVALPDDISEALNKYYPTAKNA